MHNGMRLGWHWEDHLHSLAFSGYGGTAGGNLISSGDNEQPHTTCPGLMETEIDSGRDRLGLAR
jgi:hypothetical protein